MIAGVHPVREALRTQRPIDRVLIARGAGGARLQEIIALCHEREVPVRFELREALDRAAGGGGHHQGVVAFAAAHDYANLEDVIAGGKLLVILDGVEDPHNLGAVIRTTLAAGGSAVLVPERRAAGLTATVAKAAAGALEHLPIARIGNVAQCLERLKKAGFWIYGVDERGDSTHTETAYNHPTVFVLGGEGHGLHQNVRQHCDALIRIPMAETISSLNVSVAAGVVLFEWRRQTG